MNKRFTILCSLLLLPYVYSSCESCLHDLKIDYDTIHNLLIDYNENKNFTGDFVVLAKNLLETYRDCYLQYIA